MSVTAAQEMDVAASGGRRMAYRILSGVLGGLLAALTAFMGVAGWFAADRATHRVHDLATAAVTGVLAVGLVMQARRPERNVAPFQQVIVGVLAALVALALGGAMEPPVVAGVVAVVAILVALHPARSLVARGGDRPDPALLGVAALAAVPLILYALTQADIQRACPPVGDQHCAEAHWSTMATLALTLPLVGMVAALRAPGWRITAWCAGAAGAWLGLASLVFGERLSALDAPWAAVAIAGGALFVGLAEWGFRTRPARG